MGHERMPGTLFRGTSQTRQILALSRSLVQRDDLIVMARHEKRHKAMRRRGRWLLPRDTVGCKRDAVRAVSCQLAPLKLRLSPTFGHFSHLAVVTARISVSSRSPHSPYKRLPKDQVKGLRDVCIGDRCRKIEFLNQSRAWVCLGALISTK